MITVKLETSKTSVETYQWLENNLGPGRIDTQHAWTMNDTNWVAWTGYTLNGVKRTDYRFFEFKNSDDAMLFKMTWA